MGAFRYEDYLEPLVDGINYLPATPGIYVIMNRITKRCYVGMATNLRTRCSLHKNSFLNGTSYNMLLRRDAAIHGGDAYFFFATVKFDSIEHAEKSGGLEGYEIQQMLLFCSHNEEHGFNCKIGGAWTRAARLRDRERKLMRRNNYILLDGVDLYDPIDKHVLETWLPGS